MPRLPLLRSPFCLFLACLLWSLGPAPAGARGFPGSNDGMFPPVPAARRAIDFDGRGFLIQGRRTFIVAGDVHYSRIPRALWRDRLLRIKRLGYNTVQTYTFWSYHETREGFYDFSGDKDLDAYLKLIHSLGMYAIVRVGPYVNAEWSGGGWPVWLRFKPGVVVRDDDPPFLSAMDHWLDHLLPIVAREQITRGGPVILVQLENEDSRGAGTDLPNTYFVHLRNKAFAAGIQVPDFFSGLNHGDNPFDGPYDLSGRTSPWYSTEFWTGWINVYGSNPGRAAHLVSSTWRVLAYGGAGYTHYTIAGGTNFDGWNCDEQGTNYDFGAPIGQAGDLRDVAYGLKRAALFGTSFGDLLAASQNVDSQFANVAQGIQVSARQSPVGTVVFLNNSNGGSPITTQVKGPDGVLYPTAGPMTVAPGEIVPVVEDYALAPGIKLDLAAARILGLNRQGNVTTLVAYGPPGEPMELHLSATGGKPSVIKTKCPASNDAVQTYTYASSPGPNASVVRVLVVNSHLADRTWFVPLQTNGENDGRSAVVMGPDYVGDEQTRNGRLLFQTERRGDSPTTAGKAYLWLGDDPGPRLLTPTHPFQALTARVPALQDWQAAPGAPEAQPGYADAAWLGSPDPLPMGADSDQSAYAWYRTTVQAPRSGVYGLNLSDAGDWVSAFVNGSHAAGSAVQQRRNDAVPRVLSIPLKRGPNQLALLTAHYGRAKLHAYIGPIDVLDRKGVSGPVTLTAGPTGPAVGPEASVAVNRFRWIGDDAGVGDAAKMAAPALNTSGPNWHDADTNTDVFQGRVGSAWFRATLPPLPGPHRRLHVGSIDDLGQVFLNGKRVARDVGINAGADIALDAAWNERGPNVLAVAVANTGGPGGLLGTITLQSVSDSGGLPGASTLQSAAPPGGPVPVTGWKMRGGVRLPAESAWRTLGRPPGDGGAMFYRAFFRYAPPAANGPHPILRVRPTGLSRGFVWLNGHNLGRYPEKSAVDGLYLPECWMQPGRNDLIFFDEDGLPPTGADLTEEVPASRDNVELEAGR